MYDNLIDNIDNEILYEKYGTCPNCGAKNIVSCAFNTYLCAKCGHHFVMTTEEINNAISNINPIDINGFIKTDILVSKEIITKDNETYINCITHITLTRNTISHTFDIKLNSVLNNENRFYVNERVNTIFGNENTIPLYVRFEYVDNMQYKNFYILKECNNNLICQPLKAYKESGKTILNLVTSHIKAI